MKQIGSILDEQNWLETMELACKRSIDANPEREGDFMKDGFLHCGKCKEPKREYFEWHGHQILTSRDCKCIRDEKERIEKQKQYEEKMARIARLRSVSLMDEVFYKATFKNFDITDDNRKIYNACAKYCRAFQQMLEDTPEMLGRKMQMDVKYVPRECNKGKFPEEWLFQYTMIDEATRERFIYPYKEHCGFSTVDFIKRALVHFGYIPEIIQTDNGTEFTNPKGTGEGKVHIVDKLLNKLGIKHQLIRAYTPRHNGKVERSHRSDQESFYNSLTFYSFEELREKMKDWLIRYNNRPHSSLRDKNGKRAWQSPLQKREELLEEIREHKELYHIRFLKKAA